MAVTMESATFIGKNFQYIQNSTVNTTDLTLKQMFGISAKLVGEQDEISNLETIRWEKHSWKYLSLIGEERIINLQRTKVYVFSDSVLCLVNRISPDTAIHEQNGFAKLLYHKYNILLTIVDNDKSDTTHTDMRNMQN